MLSVAVAAILGVGTLDTSLSELEARAKALHGQYDQKAIAASLEINQDLAKLIEANSLTTADEFHRAAEIYSDPFSEYEHARVKYELGLAAAALGQEEAQSKLAAKWDMLQMSLGRPRRYGVMNLPPEFAAEPKFRIEAAPECVAKVLKDVGGSKSAAAAANDNPELKELVDADQQARETDWSKLTPDQLKEIGKQDKARLTRVLEIVAAGDVVTANDFDAAALVLQHGGVFDHYRLAHELSVASTLLGHPRARWLAAASYDRMLRSCGHRQRFATQYTMAGLSPVDTSGIGDSARTAMGCPSLEAAKNRKI